MQRRRKHIKPTQSYGYVSFSKSGKITKDTFELPDEKQPQEEAVVEAFIKNLQSLRRNLARPVALPEQDNDFLTSENNTELVIEVIELLFIDFIGCVIPSIKGGESFSKKEKISWVRSNKPYYILLNDTYDQALRNKIKEKVNRHYDKSASKKLWLLIFSTISYPTEFWQGGRRGNSEALQITRRYLLSEERNSFDEIWFYDLVTNPVQVWG